MVQVLDSTLSSKILDSDSKSNIMYVKLQIPFCEELLVT